MFSRNPANDLCGIQQTHEHVWLPVMWKVFNEDLVLKEGYNREGRVQMVREEEEVVHCRGAVGSFHSDPQKGTYSEGRNEMAGVQDKAREKL